MSEDRQPNEARLSRKGNQIVPVIRTTFSQQTQDNVKQHKRSFPGPHYNFASGSKRFREQQHHAYTPSKSDRFNHHQPRVASDGVGGARFSTNRQILPNSGKDSHYLENTASRKNTIGDHTIPRSEVRHKSNAVSPKVVATTVSPPLHSKRLPETNKSTTSFNPFQQTPDTELTPPFTSKSSFRSGKITISLEGPPKIKYIDTPDPLSLLSAPRQSATPPVVMGLSPAAEKPLVLSSISSHLPGNPGLHSAQEESVYASNTHSSSQEAPGFPSATGFKIEAFNDGQLFNLKKQNAHDKPRRFLAIYDGDDIANISMHGYVDKVYINPVKQRHLVRVPENQSRESINDACVVNTFNSSIVVTGQSRDDGQVSLLHIENQSFRYLGSFNRSPETERSGGISAVCTMLQPHLFATGGFDHTIHLWNIKEDVSVLCGNPLIIKHTAPVHSLLSIRDSSHKLVSAGADCNVNIYDLSAERVVNILKASNAVHHLYRTTSPFSTLLQVAHREFQFELRDHRRVPKDPVQRFGFDTSYQKLGRYSKGDLNSNLFAFGDKDGCVRVWDLRNNQKPLINIECLAGKITHVVFHHSRLVVSSEDNHVAAVSYSHCTA